MRKWQYLIADVYRYLYLAWVHAKHNWIFHEFPPFAQPGPRPMQVLVLVPRHGTLTWERGYERYRDPRLVSFPDHIYGE